MTSTRSRSPRAAASGDPETIAYGLIPRAHRGIVAVNELPDLAERIQVSMLNVMEERDIQVRGYTLRLPLDVLVVASANPEDYTNRGRIITPLKDRFGAEIRTHYPLELDAEVGVIAQEAHLSAQVPDYLMQVIARFARYLRESSSVDQRSGVSARFAIAAAETVAASARHRGAVLGETDPVARVVDLSTVIDVLRGKLEFESGEEGREQAVLEHLLRRATADTASRALGGIDVGPLVAAVEGGSAVTTGERVSAKDVLAALPDLPVVDAIAKRLGRRVRGRACRGAGTGAWRRCIWPSASTRCPGKAKPSMAKHVKGHSSRYSAYTGGPDPLAPPVDLREALEQIGQDVMAGTSPRRALSELLRRGTKNMTGADRLAAEANRRRRELLRDNNLDGTLQEIKKLLDEAVLAERKELARALDDDARFGELQLDSLSPSPAKAVQELSDYDWRSGEARQKYEQIKDLLGREMLDQRFAGMKEALEGRHRRGPSAGQRHARRPQRPAGQARPRRGHPAGLPRLHGQARRVLPGEPAQRRGAAGLAGQACRRRAALPQQPQPGAARRAGCVGAAGIRVAGVDAGAGPAGRAPAGGPARRRLGRLVGVLRRQPARHG